jgi:hypothetical protein
LPDLAHRSESPAKSFAGCAEIERPNFEPRMARISRIAEKIRVIREIDGYSGVFQELAARRRQNPQARTPALRNQAGSQLLLDSR